MAKPREITPYPLPQPDAFEAMNPTQEELRLECLKLAHNHADSQQTILAHAKMYLDWVMNVGHS